MKLSLLLEFGARESEPVFQAVRRFVSEWAASSISVVSKQEEQSLNYRSTEGDLDSVLDALVAGRFVAVLIEEIGSHRRIAHVHVPCLGEDVLPLWGGAVDQIAEYEPELVARVAAIPGMSFVALGFEDLQDRTAVGKDTFPWDDWRLVEAVVADETGDTSTEAIRRGPAFLQATNRR